jgi:hypothetical protein
MSMMNFLSIVGPFGFPVLGLGAAGAAALVWQARSRLHVPDLNGGLRLALLATGWMGSLTGARLMLVAVSHAEPETAGILMAAGTSVTLTTTLLAAGIAVLLTPGELLAGARAPAGARRSAPASALGLAAVFTFLVSVAVGASLSISGFNALAHGTFDAAVYSVDPRVFAGVVAAGTAALLGICQAGMGLWLPAGRVG